MLQTTFEPGAMVSLFEVNYVVAEIVDEHALILRTCDGAQTRRMELATLLEHYCEGHLRPGAEAKRIPPARRVGFAPSSYSSSSLRAGAQWLSLLNGMRDAGLRPQDIDSDYGWETYLGLCQSVDIDPPPHYATIMRKYAAFLRSRSDPIALAPKMFLRGGKGKSRLSAEVQERMERLIQDLFLSKNRCSVVDVHMQLVAEIRAENAYRTQESVLSIPALSTVRRYIQRRPAYEVYAARWGKRAAQLKYRQSGSVNPGPPLGSIYEVDHTPLDLFAVDPETRMHCGRPRLTVMTHRQTRAVVGFDIGFDGNSTAAVLRCLKHALLPKQNLKSKYSGLRNEWPCFGRPSVLRCDNGKEFHSNDLVAACLDLGVELEYCPPYKPWKKGAVERFFRTLNKGLTPLLPGATSSHFYERPKDEDPTKWAVMDLDQILRYLHIWIVDIYMQTVNRALGTSPLDAWQTHFHLPNLSLPASVVEVDIACRQTEIRRLQHYGIDICGCSSFNHPALGEIRRQYQFEKTIKVEVKYDAAKLDYVFVRDPNTSEWIEVPNSDPETRQLSEFQLKAINRLIFERKRKGFSLSITDAKRLIADEVKVLRGQKTQRERKKALRLLGFDGPQREPVGDTQLVQEQATKAKPTRNRFKLARAAAAETSGVFDEHPADNFPSFESVVRTSENTTEVDNAFRL